MPRVEIELPDEYHFSTEIAVRISDINFGGHLGHDAVLTLMHEARARLFKHHGYEELNVEGLGIIMADVGIVYRSEAFFGDVLKFDLAVAEFTSKGCGILYRLSMAEDGREVARGRTGLVF